MYSSSLIRLITNDGDLAVPKGFELCALKRISRRWLRVVQTTAWINPNDDGCDQNCFSSIPWIQHNGYAFS